jgi:iron complex outermembrane receptor protein
MFVRWDYSFTDDYFTHSENTPIVRAVDDYDVHNARIGFMSADEKWNIALWGKNLADSDDLRMVEINFFGTQRGSYQPPRTYGVSATYNF